MNHRSMQAISLIFTCSVSHLGSDVEVVETVDGAESDNSHRLRVLGKLFLAVRPFTTLTPLSLGGHPRDLHPKTNVLVMRDEVSDIAPMMHAELRIASTFLLRAILNLLLTMFLILSSGSPLTEPVSAGVPYAPRLLYPGTYGNYCGPTPEVAASGACLAHGWRGDDPIDLVDAACLRHDLAYCGCAEELIERGGASPASLSVLTALRSTGVTRPFLESQGVDSKYFACVRRADQGLIEDGIIVRGNSQRHGCSAGAYKMPPWFCKLNSLTLARIEFVDFDLFLRDLDFDTRDKPPDDKSFGFERSESNAGDLNSVSGLTDLEWERRMTLRRYALSSRIPLPEASRAVEHLEHAMKTQLRD